MMEAHEHEAEDFNFFIRNYDRTHPVLKFADLSKLTILGHSLGGVSGYNFCSQNPYVCKGAINLDGFIGNLRGNWPFSNKIKSLKLTESNPIIDKYANFQLK